MKLNLYFTQVLVIELGEIIYSDKIFPDKSVAPFADGRVRKDDLALENSLQKFLVKKNWKRDFEIWYENNVDTSNGDPCYPAYKLNVSRNIVEFFQETDLIVLIYQDCIDLKIELQ